jgi:predicted nucleic acid-binding protein
VAKGKKIVLCDSGVLIEYIRRNSAIIDELNHIGYERLALSSIVVAEIYYGM